MLSRSKMEITKTNTGQEARTRQTPCGVKENISNPNRIDPFIGYFSFFCHVWIGKKSRAKSQPVQMSVQDKTTSFMVRTMASSLCHSTSFSSLLRHPIQNVMNSMCVSSARIFNISFVEEEFLLIKRCVYAYDYVL